MIGLGSDKNVVVVFFNKVVIRGDIHCVERQCRQFTILFQKLCLLSVSLSKTKRLQTYFGSRSLKSGLCVMQRRYETTTNNSHIERDIGWQSPPSLYSCWGFKVLLRLNFQARESYSWDLRVGAFLTNAFPYLYDDFSSTITSAFVEQGLASQAWPTCFSAARTTLKLKTTSTAASASLLEREPRG